MRTGFRVGMWLRGTVIALVLGIGLAPATAGDWVTQLRARWQNHKGVPSAEALAVEIDKLERHIDAFGTIVAKQPDVWGQARLMKHRDEYEKLLAKEINNFESSIQGTVSRSDQAFLASAFSLSAALGGSPGALLPQTTTGTSKTTTSRKAAPADATAGGADTTAAPQLPTNDAAGLVDDFKTDKVIQRSDIKSTAPTLSGFGASALSLEPTERADQLARFIDHIHELRRINEGDDTSASPGYALHLVRMPVSILPGSRTRKGYGAEITVTATPHLGRDLLPTTFRNLVVNDLVGQIAAPMTEFFNSEVSRDAFLIYREGKLYLERDGLSTRRIPDCFAPSRSDPPSAPEPSLIEDLPIPDTAPSPEAPTPLTDSAPNGGPRRVQRRQVPSTPRDLAAKPRPRVDRAIARTAAELNLPALPDTVLAQEKRDCSPSDAQDTKSDRDYLYERQRDAILRTTAPRFENNRAEAAKTLDRDPSKQRIVCVGDVCRITAGAAQVVRQSFQTLGANSVPALRSRNSRFAFPTTQVWEVYGEELIKPVALQAFDVLLNGALEDDDRPRIVQYHKVAGYVQDQVTAAYELLARPESLAIWNQFATPDLARAVQERDSPALVAIRAAFLEALPNQGVDGSGPYRDLHTNYRLRLLPNLKGPEDLPQGEKDLVAIATIGNKLHFRIFDADGRMIVNQDEDSLGRAAARKIGALRTRLLPTWNVDDVTLTDRESLLLDVTEIVGTTRLYSPTALFAWAILVESVLLNEQLMDDMREVASAKGATLCTTPQPYFLPCPPEEARTAFNDYVRVRFPVHVFALDPRVQEQNIADQLARSRELQLALSLAFVTGQINASSMTRFARRLELQASTIALNRTQFAFSHGEDTFGWRFQPRFQTPPTQNNLAVLSQTLGGGPTRDADIRQAAIEPGPRECVAIVLMPSFVPYVDFETRSNWYRLTHPKHTEIDPLKFLELSASIKRAYQLAQMVCDAGLYRDGDIARLVNRVRQLAAELPLQSLQTQLPFENTHGGFELFNVGTTDLAPTLRSWYGLPGVDPDNENLVFLVGDNFSVVSTNVVAGNRAVDSPGDRVNLLSKQVMSVTIPKGVQTVRHGGIEGVELSVATPYGVSQPLFIPTYKPGSSQVTPPLDPKPPTLRWTPDTVKLAFVDGPIAIEPPDSKDDKRFQRLPTKRLLVALDGGAKLDGTTATFRLTFKPLDSKKAAGTTPTPISITDAKYDAKEKAYVIEGDKYDALIADLFDSFNEAGYKELYDSSRTSTWPKDQGDKPKGGPDGGTAQATVTISGGSAGSKAPKETANALTIKWVEAGPKANADAAPKKPGAGFNIEFRRVDKDGK